MSLVDSMLDGRSVQKNLHSGMAIKRAVVPGNNAPERCPRLQHGSSARHRRKYSEKTPSLKLENFHVNDADGNLAHMPEGMDPADACILSARLECLDSVLEGLAAAAVDADAVNALCHR